MMVESTGDLAEAWKAILTKPTVNVEVACRALESQPVEWLPGDKAGRLSNADPPRGSPDLVPTAPLRKALGIEQKSA